MFCKKKKKSASVSVANVQAPTAAERTAAAKEQAVEFLTPYVATAEEYIQAAGERIGPAARQARENAARFTQEQLQPALVDAEHRVADAVDRARDRIQSDLVPRLHDLLESAEDHPAIAEASRRGQAAFAAAKGELHAPHSFRLSEMVKTTPAPPPAKRSAGRQVFTVVAVTAVVAGIAVAVRQFLAAKDDAWTAQPESRSQRAGSTLLDEDGAPAASAGAPAFKAGSATITVEPDVTTQGNQSDEMVEEGSPVSKPAKAPKAASKAPKAAAKPAGPTYGEGSYIGTEPPEGYTIKGNERSMKYHVANARGYDRTIADVWFISEDAAERAGFTRAQR